VVDIVKGVLGGARLLIIGWILPVFASLQLVAALDLPGMRGIKSVDQFLSMDLAARQLALLASAVVIGLVLAAVQAPLYRFLEGYILWPPIIADYRTRKHRDRRRKLVEAQTSAAKSNRGVYSGILYERAARYPVQDRQFAPTALGNAIRRFETYAGDRYKLDSELLWHDLTAAAPDRAVTAIENARTNVDFFVCFLYGGVVVAALGIAVTASGNGALRPIFAIGTGILITAASYKLAVLTTDEWDSAVRALVDHGRAGVAAAFGLNIPADFTSERLMWQAVNTLVRRPYAYSESADVAAILSQFRTSGVGQPGGGATAGTLTTGDPAPDAQTVHDAIFSGTARVTIQLLASEQAIGPTANSSQSLPQNPNPIEHQR
jgi:hypothetical protein